MCWITDVELEVGRGAGSEEFAQVSFHLHFSEAEQSLDLEFTVYVDLYERDDELDTHIPFAGPQEYIGARGNRDDYIGRIDTTHVRPDHESSIDLELRRDWDFGDQERGNEEYRALVHAYPEIRRDMKWSNEVSISLG